MRLEDLRASDDCRLASPSAVRELDEESNEARAVDLELVQTYQMPASNLIAVFQKS
jgi:hypothetical protein